MTPALWPRPLIPRDAEGLAFVGRGCEVFQEALKEAVFQALSKVVCSRRVRVWKKEGLIEIERDPSGFGSNRLRLTAKGIEAVVAAGAASAEELWAPRRPVALKDVVHTYWINALRVLAREGIPFAADVTAPAWLIARKERNPVPKAIPDLLLIRRPREGRRGRLLAFEVDLGGERLAATLLPKLGLLVEEVTAWAGPETRPAVLVLTRGPKRLESLQTRIAAAGFSVRVAAALLPTSTGRRALADLRTLFTRSVDSSEQAPPREVVAAEELR